MKRKLEEEDKEENTTKITKTSDPIKIINWNVNGFNALLKKDNGENIKGLISTHKPIALCLQEIKLNKDEKKYTELLTGYTGHFNYCRAKKGYSGTCVYTLNDYKPVKVTFGMGIEKHDDEGRLITVEYEKFFLVCTYVPNAGQKLERLKYRTEEWDPDMLDYLKKLEEDKPVVWTGDLNCAILDIDVHNPKTNKSAGWSYKFQAKEKNNGWRLDYFLISQNIEKFMDDSGILKDITGSDHCPIYLDLDFEK
eukprot:gene9802-2127_t